MPHTERLDWPIVDRLTGDAVIADECSEKLSIGEQRDQAIGAGE